MSADKDYYRILGVLQDAEDIVIKAAYKALAQKYHPDKFQGDAKHAKQRMQEINEAYAILSDAIERKKYDSERGQPEYEDDSTEEADDLLHTLDKDWAEASEYFPDLVTIASSLAKYSKQLEFTFKIIVIENKDFNNRHKLAVRIKETYLKKYFGTNEEIHRFAEMLFQKNRRDILKKLNRAVNLLGSDVPPDVIINKLKIEIAQDTQETSYEDVGNDGGDSSYALKYYASLLVGINKINVSDIETYVYYALKFLEEVKVTIDSTSYFFTKYIFTMDGKRFSLSNIELINFAIEKAKEFMSKSAN